MGEEFTPEIQRGIEQIVADNLVGEVTFDTQDFNDVNSKSDLYSVLSDYFENLTRSEIRQAITSSPDLVAFLDDEGLLGFL